VKESNWRRTLQSALAEEQAIAIPGEFDRVFRAYHGLVFRTAYRITGNAADAEDVSQTVFLRVFRRGEHREVLENEESYLRRAAINSALDVIRSRQADRTVELPDLPAEPAPNDPRELRLACVFLTDSAIRRLRECLEFHRCWWQSLSIAFGNSSVRSLART